MTKLTVQKIKGIMETQGSNKIKIDVQVPHNVFNYDLNAQKNFISEIAVGTPNAVVESYSMALTQPTKEHSVSYFLFSKKFVTMNVELLITNEVLEEMELSELIYEKKTVNSVVFERPYTLQELKELTDNGINSIIIEIDSSEFSLEEEKMYERFVYSLSEEIELKDVRFEVLNQNMYNSLYLIINVKIPTLKEQVESKLAYEDKITEINKNPFNSDIAILEKPLENQELMKLLHFSTDPKAPFQFLIKVPYRVLRNNEEYYMDSIIKEHVTTSHQFNIEDLRERPVGFDLETESILVLVTGLISQKG